MRGGQPKGKGTEGETLSSILPSEDRADTGRPEFTTLTLGPLPKPRVGPLTN